MVTGGRSSFGLLKRISGGACNRTGERSGREGDEVPRPAQRLIGAREPWAVEKCGSGATHLILPHPHRSRHTITSSPTMAAKSAPSAQGTTSLRASIVESPDGLLAGHCWSNLPVAASVHLIMQYVSELAMVQPKRDGRGDNQVSRIGYC